MNTKRPVFLFIIAVVSSMVSSQYACAYYVQGPVYVHSDDAVRAELMRQKAEHERRYPSQARSMEILRDLYDTNKFFYKLPSVQKQLDYLLEMFPDSIESGEKLVERSKTSQYHHKRYFLGTFFAAIGVLTVQQSINYFRHSDRFTDDSLLEVFLIPTILIGAPIITIVSLKAAFDQFKMTARWCANRLQKDREIYALLQQEAKKIKS